MSNASYGILVLPTTIQLCTALATLAMTLDKRPDLTRRWRASDDGEARKTLVEGTAESIQRAFTICLTERTSNRDGVKDGKPEGKKIGIYSFANLVLKLLFRVSAVYFASFPTLMLHPVSEDPSRRAALHQYHAEFSTIGTVPSFPPCHVPLLPGPLPLLKYTLLQGLSMPPICLYTMPRSVHQPTPQHPNLSHHILHSPRSFPNSVSARTP